MTLRQLYEQRVAAQVTEFKEVAGAVNLQAIMDGRIEPNGCYIFRERNAVERNQMINLVSQPMAHYIAFVIVSRNVRSSRGADSSDENEALCDALQSAILGWRPSGNYGLTEYSGGSLVSFRDGLLIWRELYLTTSLLTN